MTTISDAVEKKQEEVAGMRCEVNVNRGTVEYECERCGAGRESAEGARTHVRAHWLREFLGPVHFEASEKQEISWEALGRDVELPQSGAELPAFIAKLLEPVCRQNARGSYELQYVLDAHFRNLLTSVSLEKDTHHGVSSKAILDAVFEADFLTQGEMERFRALFAAPRPIIAVQFTGGVDKPVFVRPWHNICTDYLTDTNWRLDWAPAGAVSAKRAAKRARAADAVESI